MKKHLKTYPFLHCEDKEFEFHSFSVNLEILEDSEFIRTGDFKLIPLIQTCDNCGYKIEREDFVERVNRVNEWMQSDLIRNS